MSDAPHAGVSPPPPVRFVAREGPPLGLVFAAIGVVRHARAWACCTSTACPFALCYLKLFTGLPCPTCGSTRALGRLFALDVPGAFSMNPADDARGARARRCGRSADLALLPRRARSVSSCRRAPPRAARRRGRRGRSRTGPTCSPPAAERALRPREPSRILGFPWTTLSAWTSPSSFRSTTRRTTSATCTSSWSRHSAPLGAAVRAGAGRRRQHATARASALLELEAARPARPWPCCCAATSGRPPPSRPASSARAARSW